MGVHGRHAEGAAGCASDIAQANGPFLEFADGERWPPPASRQKPAAFGSELMIRRICLALHFRRSEQVQSGEAGVISQAYFEFFLRETGSYQQTVTQ